MKHTTTANGSISANRRPVTGLSLGISIIPINKAHPMKKVSIFIVITAVFFMPFTPQFKFKTISKKASLQNDRKL